MRVGIAHMEYSHKGGIERAAAELADRFAQAGNDVHYHAHHWQTSTISPVIFHRVPTLPWPHSAQLASFAWAASRQLRTQQYDITHSHGGVVGCDVVTAHSCHRAGMMARGKDSMTGSRKNWGITDSFFLRCEKKIYAERTYGKIIAVAEGVRRELFACYEVPEDHVVVIPNGVDLHTFSPEVRAARRDEARRRLGLARTDEVIIFVSNEFERKGLRHALDAVAIAHSSSRKLLVVGRDDPRPYQRYARDHGISPYVVFAGAADDMPAIFAAADLFLLPTSYEAFPLVLLEAAATGLPILITRVHGAEEFIRESVNGLFITQDPPNIAHAIQLVSENSEFRERLGHAARATALQYSWDVIAERTWNVYEDVFDQKSKKSGM